MNNQDTAKLADALGWFVACVGFAFVAGLLALLIYSFGGGQWRF